jgi:hypothetical protein
MVAKINAWVAMTRDNFIKQQDIAHLGHKHEKWNWHLHKILVVSFRI